MGGDGIVQTFIIVDYTLWYVTVNCFSRNTKRPTRLILYRAWVLKSIADWFARKNLRRHSCIHNVYYYWHDSGSYNYYLHNSPPIWRCIFIARQADRHTFTSTEFYYYWHDSGWYNYYLHNSPPIWRCAFTSTEFHTHRRMTIEIYLHWMIV